MVSSNSFVAQWSEPSSNQVCSTIQYIVTVTSEGLEISNNITNTTTYTATGLCSNSSYEINVTAVNDAGSSDSFTREVMTYDTGMFAHYFASAVLY